MKRKYITKQEDIKDCGAACLSSIIKYYGGYVPMEILRDDTLTNTEGTTAYHLVLALKKYGFDATGYKLEDILKEKIVLPAIAHVVIDNNLNHFVVIYKIDKANKTILLMDPAYGYKILSIKDFEKIWTKVILVAELKAKIPKYQKPTKLISLFKKIFKQEKALILKLILTSFLLISLSIISSFYIKVVLNNLNKSFWQLIILFLVILVFKIFWGFIRSSLENKLNTNIDEKVILPFLKHLFSLPLQYIKNKTTGEIITRVRELNNIKNLFLKIFITISLDLILILTSIFLIYTINVKSFLILCFVLIFYLFINVIFSPKIKRNIEKLIEEDTSFNSHLVENVDCLETIKNNNKTDFILEKIYQGFRKYLQTNFDFNKVLNNQEFVKNILLELGMFLVTTIGLYYIEKGLLTITDLITINALAFYIIEPLQNIASLIPEFNYVRTSFNKINEFIIIKEENLIAGEEFKNGNIKIENVSYSYDHYNLVIKDFSLLIKEGDKIMLKGTSGSGKSTLCKLIYRLYDADKGIIFINNKDITKYNLRAIRENIVYLSQKEKLFTDTIKNNITFNEKVDNKYYWQILKLCRVENIIKEKPFGDKTMVTENGFNLSGGEIQRILLSRALLKKAQIIILDEALSEVETNLETLIIKDLLVFFKEKTIIYVTHRNKEKLFDRVIDLKQSII